MDFQTILKNRRSIREFQDKEVPLSIVEEIIQESCPVCNREGPVLDVEVTRLPGVEGRGCAAVMAELMHQDGEEHTAFPVG